MAPPTDPQIHPRTHPYVAAQMPAPPFSLCGRLAGHRYPHTISILPLNLCALAGGRHSDRPPGTGPGRNRNRSRNRMQMAAPRATISPVPSYETSAVAGHIRPPSAVPHSIKGQVSLALGSLFGRRSYVTLLPDTSLVAGSSVASSLVIYAPSSRSPYASLATLSRIVNLAVQWRATVLASPSTRFPRHRRAYRPQEVGVQNRARTTPRSRRVEPAH